MQRLLLWWPTGVTFSFLFLCLYFVHECREMLDTPGPYLLDVMVPHIEHVLPMIPGGGSYKDIITTGDGSIEHF